MVNDTQTSGVNVASFCQSSEVRLNVTCFLWIQMSAKVTRLCVSRLRTSVSTARRWWSLGRKCPSYFSCLPRMKSAQLLDRIIHTLLALASSPCPCRSLSWVGLSHYQLRITVNNPTFSQQRSFCPQGASKSTLNESSL